MEEVTVDVGWRASPDSGVRAAFIVELEVLGEGGVGLDERGVAFEIDLLVFDRTPQALDEHVVQAAALAVHRELHAGGQQRLGELGGGELAALVGIEDLRRAELGLSLIHI